LLLLGAGAAGCVVASYLAEHADASIALIESGDMDRDPFIHIPLASPKYWPTSGMFGNGGGSSINAMCYVRGQIRDFAAWQDAVGDTGKWSYNDLLPIFMAQEDNDTFHDEFHGIDGGLAVQQHKGINKLNQYCLNAFQDYGVPFKPDYNGKSQIGVSPVQSTVENQRRCSAVDAYLRPHLTSGRITLLTSETGARPPDLITVGKAGSRLVDRAPPVDA
jgi:choline dehydrogenase